MSQQPEDMGRLDDEAEERQESSTTDGPAAEGRYDPRQGSPDSGAHAVRDDEAAGGAPRSADDASGG
ncbi:hypothetical protein [Nocardioides sp. SYSU DS0651]|uniref:hypothetical protein n=1 Tax=Nocardioides sp. SYSU DS0651 TaxID=3415955 RepID=UPI003F4B1ECA